VSKAEKYEAKTEKLLETIIADNNFELVDVEYVKEHGSWFLRTYIDKDGGITIDDCELVSRALSDLLDDNDFIEDSYILEVSSPGLGRQLKKDRDFAKNIGEEVDIKLYRAINKNKEITGILINYDKDKITLELKEEEIIEILRSEIAMVRLTFDF